MHGASPGVPPLCPSAADLDAIFRLAPDLTVVLDRALTIVAVNDACLKVAGARREDLVGQDLLAKFPPNPDDKEAAGEDRLRASVAEVLRTKRPHRMGLQRWDLRRPDGVAYEPRYWAPLNYPILGPDGEVRYIVHHSEEVTEIVLLREREAGHVAHLTQLQHAQSAIQASQERLRKALSIETVGVLFFNLDGRIVDANATFQRMVGYSVEELRSTVHWNRLTPQEFMPATLKAASELASYGRTAPYEKEFIRKDGSRFFGLFAPTVIAGSGPQAECVEFIIDITESKRQEHALRASERQLRFVTDNAPVMIVYCDDQARYRFVNAPYSERFGLRPAELSGKHIREVVGEPAYAALRPSVEAVLRGERVEFEEQITYAYGKRWMHSIYVPERSASGALCGFVAVIQDVTVRREAEEALRDADRRKDEFLAILAHELRNPLAPIRNGLQLLDHLAPSGPSERQVRAMMDRQLRHMVRLIDDLLDVSRITQGKIQLRKERIDLAELVKQAVEANRAVLEAQEQQLDLRLPHERAWVEADATRLFQVVSNLLNNAAKYTSHRGSITVQLERDATDAVLSVSDTGQGIAADMLGKVFDLFTQAQSGAVTSPGGLGIGLSIVKGLVELHGGSVRAESPGIGKGSTFVIRLPLARNEQAAVAAPSSMPTISAQKVLVVDDNADAANTLAALLSEAGCETQVAYDGEEALAAAREFRPDAILLDLGLPKKNGYEVCSLIRRSPGGDVPVIVALSGWGQDQDRRKSGSAGFDAHLVKPADFTDIARALRR